MKLTSKHACGLFEGSLEITLGGLAKNVKSNRLCLVKPLKTHEALNEQWLSELHVQVQEGHHSHSHIDCSKLDPSRE